MSQLVEKLTHMQKIENRSQLPHATEAPPWHLCRWWRLHQLRYSSGPRLLRRQLLILDWPLLFRCSLRFPLSCWLLLQSSSCPHSARPSWAATPRNRGSAILGAPTSSVSVHDDGVLTGTRDFAGRRVAVRGSVARCGRRGIQGHDLGDRGS